TACSRPGSSCSSPRSRNRPQRRTDSRARREKYRPSRGTCREVEPGVTPRSLLPMLCALVGCRAEGASPKLAVAWQPPIELAEGGGSRGPWQQNDSDFDYVDDPSVALAADGSAAVVW